MEIISTQRGTVLVFAVSGRMDTLTAPQLSAFLSAQITAGQHHLVADLSALNYTSSAGLRTLLAAVKDVRQHGGDLRLAAAQSGVYKVLELSGFTGILKNFPTVDAAVASFGV
ncbi:MAG: STAS domain-containing protein [Chloroflexi bacterium]|nr:STAS domain-containing protein [Chloroflexota bacterium]